VLFIRRRRHCPASFDQIATPIVLFASPAISLRVPWTQYWASGETMLNAEKVSMRKRCQVRMAQA
jgi:hypothetical protein